MYKRQAYYMEGLVLATAALAAIMSHRSGYWQWAGLALAILFIQPRQVAWGITVLLGRNTVPVSYTHLRAHETVLDLVCRLLLEKKTNIKNRTKLHVN